MKLCLRSASRHGLTLIELLVAVAILVILIGVVYLVYGTTLNTLRTQAGRREKLEPAADALYALQSDLLGALALRAATNPPFMLAPAGKGAPETFTLRLFTTWPGEGSNDWRAYGIREVEYALQQDTTEGQYALIRRCRPFRVPAPAFDPGALPASPPAGGPFSSGRDGGSASNTVTLLRSIAGLQVLVYDGSAWTNTWAAGAAGGALPQAARISLQIGDPAAAQTLSLETLIPAGHKIKAPASAGESNPPRPDE